MWLGDYFFFQRGIEKNLALSWFGFGKGTDWRKRMKQTIQKRE